MRTRHQTKQRRRVGRGVVALAASLALAAGTLVLAAGTAGADRGGTAPAGHIPGPRIGATSPTPHAPLPITPVTPPGHGAPGHRWLVRCPTGGPGSVNVPCWRVAVPACHMPAGRSVRVTGGMDIYCGATPTTTPTNYQRSWTWHTHYMWSATHHRWVAQYYFWGPRGSSV